MTEANSCARLSVVGVLPGFTTHPQKLSGAIVRAEVPKVTDDYALATSPQRTRHKQSVFRNCRNFSIQQLNGDGVKVRGWQSDSLEPAAFEHSWYLCYKALVEGWEHGWEQVRVTRMRSTCTCTPRTRDIEGSRPLGFTAQLQFLVVARFQPATSHRFPYRQGHFHIDLHQEARHPVCYTCNTLLLLSPVKFVKL